MIRDFGDKIYNMIIKKKYTKIGCFFFIGKKIIVVLDPFFIDNGKL